MSSPFKPDGYTSVSPYLIVEGAERTMAFLEQVFGAIELRRFQNDEGGIMHAEMRIDDSVVMLADAVEGWPPVPSYVHLYVADVDATFRRGVEAGAIVVQEPEQKGDDDKRGGFTDPGGTTWWVATLQK